MPSTTGGSTVSCPAATNTAPASSLPTVVDNCGNTLTPSAPVVSAAVSCEGTRTYTYTYTDCEGNSHDWVYTYTVDNNTAPVITSSPSNVTVSCASDTAVNLALVIATDDCASTITKSYSDVLTNKTCDNRFTITRTFTATDCAGNSSTSTQTITVNDITKPTLSNPGTQSLNIGSTANCRVNIPDYRSLVTATDGCGGTVTLTQTPAVGSPQAQVIGYGSNKTVKIVGVDACGNKDSITFTVLIIDNTAPNITCPAPVTFYTNTNCTYVGAGTFGTATATDACTVSNSIVIANDAPVAFPLGTTTVTWSATDIAGNVATCTQIITVLDSTRPVYTSCPSNKTVNTVSNACTYTHSDATWNATATDNCAIASLTYTLTGATSGTGTTLNGVVFNKGITTVTWTATDAAPNSTSCVYTVTVNDVTNPVFSLCPSNKNVNTNTACTYVNSDIAWNATATDNCAVTSLTYTLTGVTTGTGTTLNGVAFNKGLTTVTWTATDAAGNATTCVYTVNTSDATAPQITCTVSGNQAVNTSSVSCTYTHASTSWNSTATDNCAVTSLTYTLTGVTTGTGTTLEGVVFNKGVTNVTWTATDAASNSSTCAYTVTVTDATAPTYSLCPTNKTANTSSATCVYTHAGNTWDAIATDNCGVSTLTYSLSGVTTGTGTTLDGVVFAKGVTTVTWTATDAAGISTTCIYSITISDATQPILTCGGNQSVNTTSTTCDYTQSGTGWDATATDNCGYVSISYTLSGATTGTGTTLNGVVFNKGTTTVTWSATDGVTAAVTCSYTVTVNDATNPSISCAVSGNQAVNTSSVSCTYTHSGTGWNSSASDYCGITSLTYTLTGVTTGTGTTLAGVVFNKGLTNVTWTASDAAGNTSTCAFTVTVSDATQPQITCGASGNQAVTTNTACTYVKNNTSWDATATDNCAVTSLTYTLSGVTTGTGTTLNGVAFNNGVTTVTWTATDGITTAVTCSFTVTVTDITAPTFTLCPSSQSVNTSSATCTYTHSGTSWNATADDNCGVTSLTYTLTGVTTGTGTTLAGVVFNKGITNVTWTATDAAGNPMTCVNTVTVSDATRPIITCGSNQSVNTASDACTYTNSGTAWDATATDNCGVTSLTYTLTGATSGTGTTLNGVVFNKGLTTVTWTATDGVTTAVNCSYTINVADATNPIITCGATGNQAVNTTAACTYVHNNSNWNATATDNCAPTSITYTLTGVTTGTGTTLNGVAFNKGVTTVTWTASDAAGNLATCSYTVTVSDVQIPAITSCPTNQAVNTNTSCTYVYSGTGWDATATDNCGVTSLTYTLTGVTTGTGTTLDGVAFNNGVTIVTWTALDQSLNTNTGIFSVTVSDATLPSFTACPTSQSVSTVYNVCTYTNSGTTWNATATDNCAVTSLTYTLTGVTTGTGTTLDGVVFNKGVTTVIWTATDAASNTKTCTYTITVSDATQPIITCSVSGNQAVNTSSIACTYTQSGTGWDATATDNCSVTSLTYTLTGVTTGTGTTLGGVVFNKGVTTVTWTATDGVTTAVNCSYTVTVSDATAPTMTCSVSNQNVNTNTLCTYVKSGTGWDLSATDNCAVTSLTYTLSGVTTGTGTTLAGVAFNKGLTTVTWTATDAASNTTTCVYTVSVSDATQPTFTVCPQNQSVNTASNVCTYTHSGTTWNATATDNCAVTSLTYTLTGVTTGTGTTLAGVVFNKGVTSVTWTATDGVTTPVNCIFTVTVSDATQPIITCAVSGNQAVNTASNTCTYTQPGSTWDATATDNCAVTSLTYTLTGVTTGTGTTLAGVVFNKGLTTVTWTATDGVTTAVECSFTVTVSDATAPSMTCSVTDQTVNTNTGCTYVKSGTGWNLSATDNCAVTSLTYTLTGVTNGTGTTLEGVVFNKGLTTVTWTATDAASNTTTCVYTVTVNDAQMPAITSCPSNQSVNTVSNACTYTHSGTSWNATATDNCAVTSLTYTLSGVTSGTGTTLNGVVFNKGVTTVTWTATDAASNTNTCIYTVTVSDATQPLYSSCPSNKSVFTVSNACTYTNTNTSWDATATDNCAVTSKTYTLTGVTTGTGTTLVGVTFNKGLTTVTWSATDGVTAPVVCTYTVTVTDNVLPVITCPNDTTIAKDEFCESIMPDFTSRVIAYDNCGIASIVQDIDPGVSISGSVSQLPLVITVTDVNGNVSTCTFNVRFRDLTAPAINNTPSNITVYNTAGSCTKAATWTAPTASDNCSGFIVPTLTSNYNSGHVFSLGTTTVTYTATDGANNVTTSSFTVTVLDTIKPLITPAANVNVTSSSHVTGNCNADVAITNATISDNCSISSLSWVLSGATTGSSTGSGTQQVGTQTFNVGVTTITYTLVDGSSNSRTATMTVTVTDDENPVISNCPQNVTVYTSNGRLTCNQVATWTAPTANDNCNISTFTSNYNSGNVFPVGTTTVVYTATDIHSNVSTCTFTVTVIDNTAPVISGTPNNITEYTGNGRLTCNQTATWTAPIAVDNCLGTISYTTQSHAPGSTFPVGVTTVTYTFTDNASNTSTTSFTVTVIDNTAPVISGTPNDITVNTGAGRLTCNQTATWTAPTALDNCKGSMSYTTQSHAPGATFPVGVTTVTYTFTDDAGNTSTTSFTVTVLDNTAPVISGTPNNMTIYSNSVNPLTCSQTATWTAPTALDNCQGTMSYTTQSHTPGASFSQGLTTVTYTFTDNAGNTSTSSFTITVVDNTAPVISGTPNNITVYTDARTTCNQTATWTAPTALDNCQGTMSYTTQSHAPGYTFPVGVTTVTYTFTDGSSNTSTTSFTVTVIDNTAPVISGTPNNITVNTGDSRATCDQTATWTAPTAVDNCLGTIAYTTQSHAPGSTFSVGVTTVTYTFTDNANNTSTTSFTVTVVDNTIPVINQCPTNIVVYTGSRTSCNQIATWTAPNATDNCNVSSLTSNYNSGDVFPVGTTVVTYTATDIHNNATQSSFSVTVIDNTAPVISGTPNNITEYTGNGRLTCNQTATWTAPTAVDNCVGTVNYASQSHAPGSTFPVGVTTVTYTFTDNANNTSTTSFTVTVIDNTAPVISGTPSNITVNTGGGRLTCDQTATWVAPTAVDNCLGTISPAFVSNQPGSTFPVGVTTVTYTFSDNAGNTSTTSFTVTVVDNTAPVISGTPNDIVVYSNAANAATCTQIATWTAPTAVDNCQGTLGYTYQSHASGSSFPVGLTTVTYTFSDIAGNTSTTTFTVTVVDNTDPVIVNLPSSIAVNNDLGVCGAVVTWTAPTTTDNCSSTIAQTAGLTSGSTFPIGVTTITYTATDASNHQVSSSFTVTVTDTQLPTITAPAAIAVNADNGNCTALVTSLGSAITADVCGVSSVTNNQVSTTYPVGVTTITWTVTDIHGNIATATQTVTVTDTQNPTITAPAAIAVNADNGSCNAIVTSLGTPVTNDNCAVSSVTNDHASTTYPVGVTTVTWTVTDNHGHTTTATQIVTVTDTQLPTITAPSAIAVNADNASCAAVVTSLGTPTTGDNCGVSSVTNDHSSTSYPVGVTTVTWTITDIHGNVATTTQTVTVTDTQLPTITAPAAIAVNADNGSCAAVITSLGTPTRADNCGVASVTNDYPSTSYPVGVTTVTWTVTDVNGNSATATQTVTVTDTQNPTFSNVPSAITVNTGALRAGCNQIATWTAPTANDNCGVSGTITSNYTSGATFPVGTTTVTYTANDIHGNSNTCSFTVTVVDNTVPVINQCPSNITIYTESANSSSCLQIATWTAPTADDNCGMSSLTSNYNSGASFPVGTTMVTYTATDIHNNVTESSFNVIVIDNTLPIFTSCPSPVTNSTVNVANCMSSVPTVNPVVNDNCGVSVLKWTMTGATTASSATTGVNYVPNPYSFNVGTTTIVYTAIDPSGNQKTCTYTVSVVNNMAATIAGSTIVAQNAAAPNITFAATGGTKPYTFTYTINGGAPQTLVTTGTFTSTTVPQSTAYTGTFIYTLVSVTDSIGCSASLAADPRDTVTVLATIPRPDLYSVIDQPYNSTFATGESQEGIILISNAAVNPTTGTVKFAIAKPVSFNLQISGAMTTSAGESVNNTDWTITSVPGAYIFQSKPGVIISGNGSSKIGFTLTATGSAGQNYIITIPINNGTGGSYPTNGDSNNYNNSAVNLFYIN